jgi:uncharacterized protein
MPRPVCSRCVLSAPPCLYFKPRGIPSTKLEEVILGLDELEALRLADLEKHYQEKAAEQMKVSRTTFSRIIESARSKVADALVNGKALRVEGGNVVLSNGCKLICDNCRATWDIPAGSKSIPICPKCSSREVTCAAACSACAALASAVIKEPTEQSKLKNTEEQ